MKRQSFKVVLSDGKVAFNLGAVVESLQGGRVGRPTRPCGWRAPSRNTTGKKTPKRSSWRRSSRPCGGLVEEAHGSEAAARFGEQPSPFTPLKVGGQRR